MATSRAGGSEIFGVSLKNAICHRYQQRAGQIGLWFGLSEQGLEKRGQESLFLEGTLASDTIWEPQPTGLMWD